MVVGHGLVGYPPPARWGSFFEAAGCLFLSFAAIRAVQSFLCFLSREFKFLILSGARRDDAFITGQVPQRGYRAGVCVFKRSRARRPRGGKPFRRGECDRSEGTSSGAGSARPPRRPKCYLGRPVLVPGDLSGGKTSMPLGGGGLALGGYGPASFGILDRFQTVVDRHDERVRQWDARERERRREGEDHLPREIAAQKKSMENKNKKPPVQGSQWKGHRCERVLQPAEMKRGETGLPCDGGRRGSRGGSRPEVGTRTTRTRARRSCRGGASSSCRPRGNRGSRTGPTPPAPPDRPESDQQVS